MVRSLWLVVLVAACGKHGAADPAPCDAVGARVRTLARAELTPGLSDATRHDAELQLGPLESEVARTCRDQRWPVEVRTCLVAAATGAAMTACAATLTPEQRGALPKGKGTP